MPEKVVHEWTIPEYEQPARGMWWYLIATIVAIALLIWAVVTLNFLFAVILVMSAVILARQTLKPPKRLRVRILETGISIGDTTYEYTELRNFWILYEPPHIKKLTLTFRSAFRPSISIPLEHQNPVPLRKTLKEYLPEDLEREGEPATDALGRILKI